MTADLPGGYRMLDGGPPVAEYRELRRAAGLTPVTVEQAAAGMYGAWAAVHVVEGRTGRAVGMGRVVGDGGWYFHVLDMAVLPGHQRRGIGDAVLRVLLQGIREHAPPGAWVNLLADAPGRGLYARHGFVETAPDSLGMALLLA